MLIRPAVTVGTLTVGGLLALGPAAPAFAACDAYSGACTDPRPVVGTVQSDPGTQQTTPTVLPFTGGDVVLITALGLGALAGGTALVVAGRRRRPDAA